MPISLQEVKAFSLELWAKYSKHNSLKLGASLAYYTVFSFAPIIIIVISIVGFFFGEEAIRGEVYLELNSLLGDSAALQIQELIEKSYVGECIFPSLFSDYQHLGIFDEIAECIFCGIPQ